MGVFEYNGVSYEIDFLDLEVLKKYEDAKIKMSEELGQVKMTEGARASEVFSKLIEAIDKMFITMFGKDSIRKLFGTSKNVRERMAAVKVLLLCEMSIKSEAIKFSESLQELE